MSTRGKYNRRSTDELLSMRAGHIDAVKAIDEEVERRENLIATSVGKQLLRKLGPLMPGELKPALKVTNHVAQVYKQYLESSGTSPQEVEESGLTQAEQEEIISGIVDE